MLNRDRARKLKGIRLAIQESQARFGERFAVGQSTIQRWETEGPKSRLAQATVDRFLADYERTHKQARQRPRRTAPKQRAA